MHVVFAVGQEPIPGYRLTEEMEASAFYRLWKVKTPDGSTKLWKVIDMVVGNAAIETRSLGLLVQLRHDNLNTLTNFWQLDDGRLLVVETDVPVMTLRDRLQLCQKEGNPGISLDEAADYLEQAAAGLDFLNSPVHQFQGQQVAIYHRALRPDCLLLFNGSAQKTCKVSDFGLAKPVAEQNAQHSQGLAHYDYDPPEFFEGQTAPTSDQYSLAIVYYELRTGRLPFSGTMLEQLQARLSDTPKLDEITETERVALRKALSREPSKRWENCTAFAKGLRTGQIQDAAAPSMQQVPTPASVLDEHPPVAEPPPEVSRPSEPIAPSPRPTPAPPAPRSSERTSPLTPSSPISRDSGTLPPVRTRTPAPRESDFEAPEDRPAASRPVSAEAVVASLRGNRSSGNKAVAAEKAKAFRKQLEATTGKSNDVPIIWVIVILVGVAAASYYLINVFFPPAVTGG
ncbi:Serine/threonine-protein kinase pkn6 [Planctomycetes bacterium Pan216]|uniref:Serine/threonine-protein kinase pkn6 n=1 Tax=Kolteria novifilia TaxID=2527975 RepID=A0A518B6F5_9BACT|nr:Serine/threonine-protein kinase pkn6 [Planctomycetes bacterium Pan216]